jgi:hypothetical protein
MRKILIAILVLAIVAVGGYFGVNAYAQNEAERQVATIFQNIEASGARHGAVAFDLTSRSVTVSDIALNYESEDGATTIGRITATGLGQVGADRVKADRIEISDFAYDGPIMAGSQIKANYRVPLTSVEQYEGPTQISVPNGEPGQVARAFLLAASAKRITVPSVTAVSTVGSGDDALKTESTYGTTVLEELSTGKVARAASAPFTYSVTGPKPRTGSGTMGKITAEAIDLAASLGLFDPQTDSGGGTYQPLFGMLTIDGFTENNSNGRRGQAGMMSMSNLAVRPDSLRFSEFMALGAQLERLKKDGRQPDTAETIKALEVMGDIVDAFQFGSLELADLDATGEDGAKVALKHFGISKITDGRIENLSLDGLAMTIPDGESPNGKSPNGKSIKLDRFAVHGLRFGSLMHFGAATMERGGVPATRAERLEPLQFLDSIEIGGLESPIGLSPDDVVKVDTFQLSWGDFIGPLPSKTAATIRMSGPIDQLSEKELFSLLAENGATRANLAFDGGMNWNEADKTITAAPLFVEVDNAFSASAKVTLTGVDKASFFSADQAEALKGALASNVGSINVTLTDAGIYAMKLKQVAEDQGATPEAVQQMTAGIAQIFAQQLTSDRPELEGAAKAIVDFLSAPKGRLVLKITPKTSLPLITVVQAANNDPMSLLDEVNIEATVSR